MSIDNLNQDQLSLALEMIQSSQDESELSFDIEGFSKLLSIVQSSPDINSKEIRNQVLKMLES